MKPLRLAVIGLGAHEHSRARGYLATIAKLADRYTLCALCDRDPQVVFGGHQIFSSLNAGT